MEKIDGACHSATGGWLSHCVSRTRPTRASARLTYHSFNRKILSPLSLYKNTGLTLYDQAAFVRFVSRVDHSRRSRVWRVLSGRSGAVDWSWQSDRGSGGSQRAAPARASPRRDVCGPRCCKLAASRARVARCRSWGLGLHLPILPYFTWQV